MPFLRDKKELFAALSNIQEEKTFGGICLTNSDPEADWLAITDKNHEILNKNNLCVTSLIDRGENGTVKITTILHHKKSGQNLMSSEILDGIKNGGVDSQQVFLVRRMQYEGLLGIVSSNDAIEAELFGPKRKHRELTCSYDKTAEFIDFDYNNQDGEIFEEKINRKEFEKNFLGMTSEEEKVAKFKVPDFRKFSWGDIKLFFQCKRCFYNAKKIGIKPPVFDSESFALPKAVDALIKKEFDKYRENAQTHSIMAGTNAIRPLIHKKLKGWQAAWNQQDRKPGGIQFKDVWGNWLAYGGVDDIWINDKKELVVVDYKTIAQEFVESSGENIRYIQTSKRQIEFYAWLLRKNNYTVSSTGYLLFYNALTDKDSFDCKLEFESHLIEHKIDDSWVQKTIDDALLCLEKDTRPLAENGCRV